MKLHHLLAVVDQANSAIGHHAVNVAKDQLDSCASLG
jgi:hypothetical protein